MTPTSVWLVDRDEREDIRALLNARVPIVPEVVRSLLFTCDQQEARIAALQEALRDVLAVVWSGSSADRKFWRDEAVATFERAAALAQDDTASVARNVKENAT